MFTIGQRLLNATLVAALLLASAPAFVQRASAGEGIGIVTAIQGQAAVSRASLPQPAALRFKDDVFFRDEIATRERSTLRLLLGGKGTLTIREQSQVTLDESVTPDGGRRSVIGLLAGKIGAAIAHALMRPGESVEMHTPNAVAAVRGTVLIAEYIPPQGSAAASQPILLASAAPGPVLAQAAGAGGTSNFFVLSGQVTITPQGQSPLTLGPLQAVSVTTTPGGVQAGAVRNITPAQAAQAAQGLETGKPHTGEAEASKTAQAQAQVAAAIANVILQATTGPATTGQPTTTTVTAAPTPTNTVTPVVTEVSPSSIIGPNILPAGPLLSLSNLALTIPDGTTVMNFANGPATGVVPIAFSGTGITSTVGILPSTGLFNIQGNPITHSGPLLSLDSAQLAPPSTTADPPLMQFSGTTVTLSNPTAAFATVDNNSVLAVTGNLFTAANGATLNVSGTGLNISNGGAVFAGQAIYSFQNASTFNWSGGGAAVQITNGYLYADHLGESDGSGNQITLGGTLIDATNAYIVFQDTPQSKPNDKDVVIWAQPAGVPMIQLMNSYLYYLGGDSSVIDIGQHDTTPNGKDYNGLLLIATGSYIYVANGLLDFDIGNGGVGSTTEATTPLIQLTDSYVYSTPGTETSDILYLTGNGSFTMAGPLMAATGSALTAQGSLFHLDQMNLTVNTSQPLLQFTNTSFDNTCASCPSPIVSPIFLFTNNASLNLAGGGSLLSSSNTSTPSTPTTTTNGPLMMLDNALLNAANATIFQITNGNIQSNIVDSNGAIQLYNNSVVTAQQFASLNNTSIQIMNGPMIYVASGSQMTITGDFATLTNGAKITVLNGPLMSVDGTNSKLMVNGALVNFGGTGGNQIIVNNTITPNNSASGIPYYTDAASSTKVSIGPNPVKNPSLGTISVTGSLIQATNGGGVTITAP